MATPVRASNSSPARWPGLPTPPEERLAASPRVGSGAARGDPVVESPPVGLERSLVSVVTRRDGAALPAVRALRAALLAGAAAGPGGRPA